MLPSIAKSSNLSPFLRALSPSLVKVLHTSQVLLKESQLRGSINSNQFHALLSKPTWSVKSLLGKEDHDSQSSPSTTTKITQSELHHLLRLSALPIPKSKDKETKMIKTLESQLHFVRAIQNVDATGVKPLQAIRDETEAAEREQEITLDSLKADLEKEEVIGPSKRVKRKIIPVDTTGVEDWDPLERAPKKLGRYIIVETGKAES
ncbi:MAG: hypothetical protein MMC33_000063 [Icmadophila ericetorum]|nr:hypothetical protein [Icmadophila ericetorum]